MGMANQKSAKSQTLKSNSLNLIFMREKIMKLLAKSLIALGLGSIVAMGAQANVDYGLGQSYVGVKVGSVKAKEGDNSVRPTAYGVYAGYAFTPNANVELEYQGTSEKDDVKLKTFGGFAGYNYYIPSVDGLYGKGKLGVVRHEVKNTADDVKETKTGIAGGLGLGYDVNPNFSVEALYTKYPNVKLDNGDKIKSDAYTVGAHLKF